MAIERVLNQGIIETHAVVGYEAGGCRYSDLPRKLGCACKGGAGRGCGGEGLHGTSKARGTDRWRMGRAALRESPAQGHAKLLSAIHASAACPFDCHG
jgi:hypothetical protein